MTNSDNAQNPQTAYSANITKGLLNKTQTIAKEIESLLIINKDSDAFKIIDNKVIAIVGDLEHVAAFLHPIIDKNKAYIDIRGFITKDGGIRNYYEYVLLVRRALLDLAWVNDKEIFSSQSNFVIDTFSSWFSYGLQRNTNASLLTATNYRIIAAIYYLGLFSEKHIFKDEDVILYILKKLPRMISIPAQLIDDLITLNESAVISLFNNGSIQTENRILQLSNILTVLTNEAFTIDPGIIYNSLCRGAFIASNSIEIASIAIEHPPTLIAMISCVTQKGLQNKTALGKAVLGIMRKHDMDSYNKFIMNVAGMSEV